MKVKLTFRERERERLVKYIKINCFFFFKLCFFDFFDRYGKVFFFFFWVMT